MIDILKDFDPDTRIVHNKYSFKLGKNMLTDIDEDDVEIVDEENMYNGEQEEKIIVIW